MTEGLRMARLAGIFAAAATITTPALAGTDGALGATSQGSIVISATVPGRVKLTKLTDVTFANADPSSAALSTQSVCVWSNTAGRKYTIRATGSGLSSAFTLDSGSSIVPYSVQWAQSSGQSSGTPLLAGTIVADQASAAVQQDCGTGASASLIVGISSDDLQTMTAATPYTGTLTLLVSPQ